MMARRTGLPEMSGLRAQIEEIAQATAGRKDSPMVRVAALRLIVRDFMPGATYENMLTLVAIVILMLVERIESERREGR